jgi:hypothetical protein
MEEVERNQSVQVILFSGLDSEYFFKNLDYRALVESQSFEHHQDRFFLVGRRRPRISGKDAQK